MNKKKLLALLMALVMTFSLLPVTAMAENEPVAPVDLQAQFDNGGEVTLTQDVTLTEGLEVEAGKTVILDLNGHTISDGEGYDDDYLIGVMRGGNLTVTDNSQSKNGAINATGKKVYCGIKVTLAGEDDPSTPATLTVNGGSITGYYYGISGNGTRHNTAINVTGGTITGTNGAGIYHPQEGTLTISGGTMTGKDTGIEVRSGTLNVTGGTFVTLTSAFYCTFNGNGSTTEGAAIAIAQHTTAKKIEANISGATFEVPEVGTAVAVSVQNPQGNTFDNVSVSANVVSSSKIPEGYVWQPTENGYELLKSQGEVESAVARIGNIPYNTLADAIDAAQDGQTITLLSNVALTATVNIDKNLTINLNGHNITATDARALWVESGDVTITGTGTISSTHTEDNTAFKSDSSVIRVGDKAANENKAKLTIGEGVTVSTDFCYGITVFGNNDSDNTKDTSDIELVVNGKVNVTGSQAAISGNGTNTLSATTMTIGANAVVTATGDYAIYHPGKGTLTVNGTVTGKGGIEVKSGTVNINNGATVTANATAQSHVANGNGTSTSGYAIAAISNAGYVGDPTVTINGNIVGTVITLADGSETLKANVTATTPANVTIPAGYSWDDNNKLTKIDGVAAIGTTGYPTLKEAIDAANPGDTITLLENVDATAGNLYNGSGSTRIPIKTSMTIDGNGHTIEVSRRGFGVGDYATAPIDVTFKNVTIHNNSGAARCIDTRGNLNSLTLDKVTLSTDGAPSGYTQPLTIGGSQSKTATININNSTIKTNDDATAYYAIITFNPVNMTIDHSTIMGWACIYAKGPDSSAGSAGSEFTITNSTLVSKNIYDNTSNAFAAVMIETDDVTVNIENTDITINADSDQKQGIVSYNIKDAGDGIVALSDGNNVNLNGENAVIAVNSGNLLSSDGYTGKVAVTGGTFNVEPDARYIAEDYKAVANSDGTWTVKAKDYVAQVGSTKYETLEAAAAAAQPGATVKLIADIDYSTTYTVRNARDNGDEHVVDLRDLTLDMDGHTISTINATVEFGGNGATIENGTFNLVPKNTDGSYKEGSYALIIDNNGDSADTVLVKNVVCNGGINLCSATVTLDNVTARSTPNKFYAVWAETNATVTILSGTYTDTQTGGRGVLATGTGNERGAKIYVTGGSYNAGNKVVASAEANSIQITGGIFTKDPTTQYIATGYEAIENPDPITRSTYEWTVGVIEGAFIEVEDANEDPVTKTSGDTTFSFATATTGNPNDDVTYAIKTTTNNTQVAYTPVQTDIVTKPAVSQNAANVSGDANEDKVAEVKEAVEKSAASGTTKIQAKQGEGDYGNVNLLTTQAAAKAITKAAANVDEANDIAKVEIQLQTKLTSYTLAGEGDSVVTTALIYQVTPQAVLLNASGVQLCNAETLTNRDLEDQGLTLKFELPVPDSAVPASNQVIVTHRSAEYGDSTSLLTVQEDEAGNHYVVIETTHFSEFELTPYVVDDTNQLITASLTLGGSIDLNFYLKLQDDVTAVRFTYRGTTTTVSRENGSYDSVQKRYKFSIPVAAKDIYKDVTIELLNADKATQAFNYKDYPDSFANKFTYSVAEYVNYVKDNGKTDAEKALARSLGTYGYYANRHLLKEDGNTVYNTVSNLDDDAIISYKDWRNPYGTYPISGSGMTLLLRSETVIAYRFDDNVDYSGYKFYFTHSYTYDDGGYAEDVEYEVDPVRTGNYWYVNSKGIPAAYLDRGVTFKIVSDTDGEVYSTTYSPMIYGGSMLSKNTTSETLRDTIRAMYDYNQKAREYFQINN